MWKKGVYRCDWIKDFAMERLFWILWVGLNCHPFIRQKFYDTYRRGGGNVTWQQKLEWWGHKPRNACIHQNLGKVGDRFPTYSLRRECCPASTWTLAQWYWFLTFSLQKSRRVHFCCFKPLFVVICHKSHRKQIQGCYHHWIMHLGNGDGLSLSILEGISIEILRLPQTTTHPPT